MKRAVHSRWRFSLLAAALAFALLLLFAQPHQHVGTSQDGQQCVACAVAQLSSTPAQSSLDLLPPLGLAEGALRPLETRPDSTRPPVPRAQGPPRA